MLLWMCGFAFFRIVSAFHMSKAFIIDL
jgi:hypothetical protein